MLELRKIEQDILATGKVNTQEVETLRKRVYSGGKVARPEADFLVELHKRVQHRTPAFDEFFYQAVKVHMLRDGQTGAEAAAWLREVVFADGKIDDEERKLLHELRGQARQVSREFEALFEESMKQPPERHTSG